MSAIELLTADKAGPHNPEWHQLRRYGAHGWSITASEIAGVLGISPWHSPFSLYWSKRLDWRTPDNPFMAWGRRFEGVIGEEFAESHPDLNVWPTGLLANSERPWQMATPDLMAGVGNYSAPPFPVQIKTDYSLDPEVWGPEGSDVIPVHYRAQVQWEIDVTGADEGVLYVLPLDTRQPRMYVIPRDETDLRLMRTRGEWFRLRLDDDTPPDLDSTAMTLKAVKHLHPDIEDCSVEIPPEVADGYRRANALARRLSATCDLFESRVREAMGNARYATLNGRRIASRSMYPHYRSQKIVDKLTETKGRRP